MWIEVEIRGWIQAIWGRAMMMASEPVRMRAVPHHARRKADAGGGSQKF